MNLQGKTIILTGAARIGQDVARYLKEQGANLVLTYFSSPSEVEHLGFSVKADVSRQADIENLIQEAKKKFGRIDGLVHMAANYHRAAWEDLNEEAFDKSFNPIARSTFLIGKMVGDEILKNEGDLRGKMIFFSDWSVLNRPYRDYLAYNGAKSAVVSMAKSMAKELAPHVLVNIIAPGPMIRPPDLDDKENEEVLAGTLLKRWGGGEEIAKGVRYLFDADFITGHVLTIDGGRTIT